MPNFAVEHIDRVRPVVQSRTGPERVLTPNRISQSRIGCLDEYRLDLCARAELEVVPATELQKRQERLADVHVAGSGYAIMLTGREGVRLNYFGNPTFAHAASKAGLTPGAVSSERTQGAKGMGTCVFERRPVTGQTDLPLEPR